MKLVKSLSAVSIRTTLFVVSVAFFSGMLYSVDAVSQTPANLDNLKNVLPPSPNSSAFAKYGDWPVSLYTGVPEIHIPITTLQGRSVNVPISLSYHASGNRVGDIASWVGLSWSLNAGGVITRSVRGLNDESGFYANQSSYTNPNDLSTCTSTSLDKTRAVNTARSTADSEPDVYSINALGKSYRLLLLADGTVQTVPQSNLKFVSNPIVGSASAAASATWTVTTEDGTTLLFGGSSSYYELTDNQSFQSSDGSGLQFISSWMLKSITSQTGEVINFTYSATGVEQDSYWSESDFIQYPALASVNCQGITQSSKTFKVSGQNVSEQHLSVIESDMTRIEFAVASGRQDLYGGVSLSEIKVYSKLTNQYVERYVFNTIYSTAVAGNELSDALHPTYYRKRLRLISLERKDIINPSAPSQKWQFAYNAQNLPSRRSYAQDHWGFFNGATTNVTLLPRLYFRLPDVPGLESSVPTTGFMPDLHELGANRAPSTSAMQAEMLTRITFPTGGYTDFVYEPNSIPVTKETFTDAQTSLHLNIQYNQSPFVNTLTTTFTITTPSYVSINLDAFVSQSILTDQPGALVTASVLNSSGTVIGMTSGNAGISSRWLSLVQAGTYTLKVSANVTAANFQSGSDIVTGDATLSYPQSNGSQSFNEMTGGLRVASITDFDGSRNVNRKYFQYSNALVIAPIDAVRDYLTTQASVTPGSQGGNCNYTKAIRSSSTKFAAGSIQGGTTGYGKVTTKNGPAGENGYTVSIFSNQADDYYASDPHDFPYPPAMSNDHRRGLLVSEKTYSAQNLLLKRTYNTYAFDLVGRVIGFKAGYATNYSTCTDPDNYCGIVRGWYGTIAEKVKHLTSVDTIYDNVGANPMVTKTTNYFDTPANTQPVRFVTRDSNGDSITVYNKTALEMAATGVYASLQAKNMVSQVLTTEKYVNSSINATAQVNYSDQWPSMTLPQNAVTKIGTGASVTSMTVTGYDTRGNVTDFISVEGVPKSYIWAHSGTRPIAEGTNAKSSDIAFTSFESDGDGRWVMSSTARLTDPLTGYKSYSLSTQNLKVEQLTAGASYVVSVWAKVASTPSISINGIAATAGDIRKGWRLYQAVATPTTPNNSVTITGTGTIDEVRLVPSVATINSFTYGPYGILTSTDIGNVITFFEYDGFGRLTLVRDDNNKILKTYKYHYQQ